MERSDGYDVIKNGLLALRYERRDLKADDYLQYLGNTRHKYARGRVKEIRGGGRNLYDFISRRNVTFSLLATIGICGGALDNNFPTASFDERSYWLPRGKWRQEQYTKLVS